MVKTLLIATANPGKVREIKEILSSLDGDFLSAKDLSLDLKVDETGVNYAENARKKAAAYLRATGMIALADDSGLEVDVLGGAPGLFSARFSPKENASDADRRAYLLEQLKELPQPWIAHFHCTAVLALPGEEYFETTGRCEGVIIPDEHGAGGFGYDPIFYLPEFKATMAELSPNLKNRISHRAIALSNMIPIIKKVLAGN